MKRKYNSTVVQTRLTPEYIDKLDKICASYGTTRSMYVREMLIKNIDGMDDNILYKALSELQNEIHKQRINQQTMTQLWLYWLGNYFGKHPDISSEEERRKIAAISLKKVDVFLRNFSEHTFEYSGDLYDMIFADSEEKKDNGKK